MKVIEDGRQDRFGNYPIIFQKGTVKQIHEWLFNHYHGYKFAIILDTTHEYYEEVNDAYVYFLDETLPECFHYAGKDIILAVLQRLEDTHQW